MEDNTADESCEHHVDVHVFMDQVSVLDHLVGDYSYQEDLAAEEKEDFCESVCAELSVLGVCRWLL